MEASYLVVSNPPHHQVDHDSAAELLGIATAEMRLKANYPAPEIWLALPSAEEADKAASALGGTGLSIAVIAGRRLLTVPGPALVSSFEFTEHSFLARFQDGELELPYDAPIFGVFCRPPPGIGSGGRSSPSSMRLRTTLSWRENVAAAGHETGRFQGLELLTNLDLYHTADGEVSRISIVQESADFSGLGELKDSTPDADMAALLSECKRLFQRLKLDRRLMNIRPRQRPQVGGLAPPGPTRRLYAFGTMTLRQLLESIDPRLREITQFELGSRLAFLMGGRAEGDS